MLVSVGMKNCTGRPKTAILSELSEMQSNPTPSPQRLLVIKHGALGDIVKGLVRLQVFGLDTLPHISRF